MRFLFIIVLLLPVSGFAENWWTIEARLGTAFSFGTTLEIEQQNQPQLRFDADYETRPFEDAPYYGLRAGWRNSSGGWEVEFLHHKIYLTNHPAEVQHFEVSHGYNLLMFNRLWIVKELNVRAGGGIVISHTESTIRDLTRSAGQEITGVAGQFSVGKDFYLTRRLYFGVETKLTFANATVSIAEGDANAPNIAIHILAGLGYATK